MKLSCFFLDVLTASVLTLACVVPSFAGTPAPAAASDTKVSRIVPVPDHPFIAGVTSHMAWNISSALVKEKLADLGMRSIRDEAYWAAYEREKGVYDIRGLSLSIQEAMTGKFDVSNSILVLDYGNPHYRNGARPVTDDVIEGFVNYAVNIVKAGGWRWGFIQVWNEWNLPMKQNGETEDGNAADYVRLFNAVAKAIRPLGDFKILTNGTVDRFDGYKFQREMVDHGVLQYADGFAHHSYNWGHKILATPGRLMTRLEEIQVFLTAANGGKPVPIYVTEAGWPLYAKSGYFDFLVGPWTADFLNSAKETPWIKGVWLYNLFDKGSDYNEPENGFGIYKPDGQDKVSTPAIRKATRAANLPAR